MSEFDAFMRALAQQESGGNYNAYNKSGATGKYQILASNVGPWAQRYLGRNMSVSEFRNNPSLQDQLATAVLKQYVSAYGFRGAASAWYSGNPNAHMSTRAQRGGPSIKGYVDSIMAKMGNSRGAYLNSSAEALAAEPGQESVDQLPELKIVDEPAGVAVEPIGLKAVGTRSVGLDRADGSQPLPEASMVPMQQSIIQEGDASTVTTGTGLVGGAGTSGVRQAAVDAAMKLIGVPYVWGGESGRGVDCVASGSMVTSARGAVPIEELRPGDRVLTSSGFGTVGAVVHKGKRPTRKIRLRNRTLTVTDNHRVGMVAKNPGRRSGWSRGWGEAGELKRGDYVLTLRHGVEAPDGEGDLDEAWMWGLFLGDGHYRDRHIYWCVYGETRERLTEILSSKFGVRCKHSDQHGVTVASKALVERALSIGIGTGSDGKRVPSAIWSAGPKTQLAFIEGYLAADGHVDRKGWWTFHSISRRMLEEVRHLCILNGMNVGNVRTTERTKPIVIKGKLVKNAKTIFSFQVYNGEHVVPHYITAMGGLGEESHVGAGKVLSVSPGPEVDVWDIEVLDGPPEFFADGVLVHNCSGLTKLALAAVGIRMDHYHARQLERGRVVPISKLKPGDLVGWRGAEHVAMYVGNNMLIEAPRPGKSVVVRAIGNSWDKSNGVYGVSLDGLYGG